MMFHCWKRTTVLAIAAAAAWPITAGAVVENISNATPNPITVGQETSFNVDVDAFLTSLGWNSTAIFVDNQFYACVNQPDPGYGPGSGPVSETITVPVMAPLDEPGTYDIGAEDHEGLDCQNTGGGNDNTTPLTVVAPPDRATFEVSKVFTDGNPGSVTVTISCNTGLPLEQSKEVTEAEGVEFVVTEYDDGELDCVITEDGVVGYDAEYDDGSTVTTTGCEYLDVAHGAEFTCEITNTPAPVDVVIEKDWIFEGTSDPQGIDTSYRLTLWCDAEIVGGYYIFDVLQEAPAGPGPGCGLIATPVQEVGQTIIGIADWCKTFFGDGSDTFEAQVIPEYPDSHCFVTETVYDSAVEVDNDCNDLTVSAGQGDSCTITNLVFFEGIPTLSQYGMALLALLMLGMGLVGFRRFV